MAILAWGYSYAYGTVVPSETNRWCTQLLSPKLHSYSAPGDDKSHRLRVCHRCHLFLLFVKLHLIFVAKPFQSILHLRIGEAELKDQKGHPAGILGTWNTREHPGTPWAKPWGIHVLIGWSLLHAVPNPNQTQMVSNQTWRYCSGFEKSFARSLPFLVLCLVASCLREWAKVFTQRNSTQIFPDSNHYGHPKNTQFLRSPSIHCSYHWGMGVGIINPENCMIYH